MHYKRKIIKYVLSTIFIVAITLPSVGQQMDPHNYTSISHKADSLLSKMTLEEKAGQLTIYGGNQKGLKKLIEKGLVGGTNGMLPGRGNVSEYLTQLQKIAMQSRLKIPLLFMGDVIHGYRTTFPV